LGSSHAEEGFVDGCPRPASADFVEGVFGEEFDFAEALVFGCFDFEGDLYAAPRGIISMAISSLGAVFAAALNGEALADPEHRSVTAMTRTASVQLRPVRLAHQSLKWRLGWPDETRRSDSAVSAN
jgi:hypothetical protein